MFRLTRTLLVLMIGLLGSRALAANTVEVQYHPVPGYSLNYGMMGYTDEDGNFLSLEGQPIVSARAHFEFTPDQGTDASTFVAGMVVPVTGATSEFFLVEGTQFTQSSPGLFTFDLPSTTDFNGIVRGGRFSVDCYAVDPDTGDPIAISGDLSSNSGFFFTVAVPEPASAAGLGILFVLARRKR